MTAITFAEYAATQEARENIALAVLGHTYALCEALRQNYVQHLISLHESQSKQSSYHTEQIAKLKAGICDTEFYPETGRKYHKIMMNSNGSRSTHAFIDKQTGSVLKPASWKSPAKGERYNLLIIKDREWLFENASWCGGYLYKK